MINPLQQFQRGQFCSLWVFLVLILGISTSCSNEIEGEVFQEDQAYNLEIPTYFPALAFDTGKNPVTANGVALGKKLFYEGKLSRNNTISCGFCHIQEYAFTHHGHPVSHGIDDKLGMRNAPAIQNMAWLKNYT